MGKNKKPPKTLSKPRDRVPSIKFELEENAHQLLLDHIDSVKPAKKDAENDEVVKSARKRTDKRKECSIDLHGLRLDEAEELLQLRIEAWLATCSSLKLQIITGKGRHSKGGEGVLAREIHRFIRHRYQNLILDIEESPSEVRLSGVPIRGHFHVVLKGIG